MKIFESEKTLAFLDIQPLSYGHSVGDCLRLMLLSNAIRDIGT